MNRILLTVLLLLVWGPAAALADYDARKSEAMAQLDKAEMTTEERAAIKKALDTYFGGREDCFEGLIAIVAKKDESPQHPAFRDRVGVCAVGMSQVLSRALADIKEPSKGALDFVNTFSGAEAAFYDSLRTVLVTEARDLIVVIRINLVGMTEVLDGKWDALVDQDESLDDRAKKLSDDIRTDLTSVIQQAAESHKDTAELIAEAIKKYAESLAPSPATGNATVDNIIGLVRSSLSPLISTWQAMNTRSAARVSAYRTLFTSERRVLVMFEEVRDDVKEFLEKNDYPLAEAAFARAKSSLDSFASSGKTSGQSRDASELRDDLMDELTDHLKETADVYGKFVGKHKEKFFGALGPNIKEELVEHRQWEQYEDALKGYSLDAKLRAWQDDANAYFGVDLSRLPSDARERLKKELRVFIDDLVKQLNEAGKTYRDVETVIDREREDVEKELH